MYEKHDIKNNNRIITEQWVINECVCNFARISSVFFPFACSEACRGLFRNHSTTKCLCAKWCVLHCNLHLPSRRRQRFSIGCASCISRLGVRFHTCEFTAVSDSNWNMKERKKNCIAALGILIITRIWCKEQNHSQVRHQTRTTQFFCGYKWMLQAKCSA